MAHWTDVITEESTSNQIETILGRRNIRIAYAGIERGNWVVMVSSTGDLLDCGLGSAFRINEAIVRSVVGLEDAIARRMKPSAAIA